MHVLDAARGITPWLDKALDDLLEFNVFELHGDGKEHPRILQYHSHTSLQATRDEVPWCSAAVCCWLEESGCPSPHSARARSFVEWGEMLMEPSPGAIAVYWRGSNILSGLGHVGLLLGRAGPATDLILGGNQSDAVCVRTYTRSKLLSWRWPNAVAPTED